MARSVPSRLSGKTASRPNPCPEIPFYNKIHLELDLVSFPRNLGSLLQGEACPPERSFLRFFRPQSANLWLLATRPMELEIAERCSPRASIVDCCALGQILSTFVWGGWLPSSRNLLGISRRFETAAFALCLAGG